MFLELSHRRLVLLALSDELRHEPALIAGVDVRKRGQVLTERVDRGHVLAHRGTRDVVVQECIDDHSNLARPPPVDGGLADARFAGNALDGELLNRKPPGPESSSNFMVASKIGPTTFFASDCHASTIRARDHPIRNVHHRSVCWGNKPLQVAAPAATMWLLNPCGRTASHPKDPGTCDYGLRPGGLDHSGNPHYRIQYDTFSIDIFHEIQAAFRRRERIPRPCHRCLWEASHVPRS